MEKWNINRTQYTISDFLDWQRNKNLELSPSFQRRPVWQSSAKSYLIDTIARGLPIPIIFIREKTDLDSLTPKRQVVDGQQRIRTVLAYIDPKSLKDYKESRDYFQVKKTHNKELSGKNFGDLRDEYKQRILDYKFSVHVLPSDVDDKQVLQIFARMNATGVKLNPQELRNAKYFGEFKQTMYLLAYGQLERWRNWGIFDENQIARMQEVELVSDLVMAVLKKQIMKKTTASLDNIYKQYDDTFTQKEIIKTQFEDVMDKIDDKLGSDMLSIKFRNKTLFYILFLLVYDICYTLSDGIEKSAKKQLPSDFGQKIRTISDEFDEKNIPNDVLEAANRRTTDVISRKKVFDFVKKGVLNGC